MALLSIVIPCYNEEAVIEEAYRRLMQIIPKIEMETELIFVNDGSKDHTQQLLTELASKAENIRVINFSRNFGHQLAITAGMDYASGDAIVIIDADLQDPVEVIIEMVAKWKSGFDVVYGKRMERLGETAFKKSSAKIYYWLIDHLSEEKIPRDVGDFRLIDRKVADALKRMPERSRYVRGLIAWLGFQTTSVEFTREARFAGKTKYSFSRMLKLAFNGIFSFSYKPLRLASFFGAVVSFISFIYLVVVLYQGFFTDSTVSGWASLMTVLLFFCGILLLALGIIGEYIARIYEEVKARPMYIVDTTIGLDNGSQQTKSNGDGCR